MLPPLSAPVRADHVSVFDPSVRIVSLRHLRRAVPNDQYVATTPRRVFVGAFAYSFLCACHPPIRFIRSSVRSDRRDGDRVHAGDPLGSPRPLGLSAGSVRKIAGSLKWTLVRIVVEGEPSTNVGNGRSAIGSTALTGSATSQPQPVLTSPRNHPHSPLPCSGGWGWFACSFVQSFACHRRRPNGGRGAGGAGANRAPDRSGDLCTTEVGTPESLCFLTPALSREPPPPRPPCPRGSKRATFKRFAKSPAASTRRGGGSECEWITRPSPFPASL